MYQLKRFVCIPAAFPPNFNFWFLGSRSQSHGPAQQHFGEVCALLEGNGIRIQAPCILFFPYCPTFSCLFCIASYIIWTWIQIRVCTGPTKMACFRGHHPILGDTCCRLKSLDWDKDRNTITECWERVLDEEHDQKDKKKPGKNQTIPKKPMKGPGVSKDSVKPTPMKSKPAKKATTWQKAWGWKSPTMKPIFLLSFYDNIYIYVSKG